MKNPVSAIALPKFTKEWFGGMDVMDMGAALGGLAASTMLPGMLMKTPTTTGQKIWKAMVSFAAAIGAGFVLRNVSASAGKYAVAGGVAGALAQTIGLFSNIKIGDAMQISGPGRHVPSGLGQTPGPGFEELRTH